ncbi:MAG: hypothetical protein ABI645_09015 [Pseudomonadota bacterium]
MTIHECDDLLVGLWQSGAKPDTAHLMRDLERQNRTQLLQQWLIIAVLGCSSILLAFAEATGGLRTHGILSLTWLSALGLGGLAHFRARHRRAEILNLDTQRLLDAMISRAERGLMLARFLYAGTPVGAVAGYAIVQLTHVGIAVTHRPLGTLQAVLGVMLLVVMVVAGLLLARARRAQLVALIQKKRDMEVEL